MAAFHRSPIAVMAFNRADYLEQVVGSLMAQRGCDIERRSIFLFQDGAKSAFGHSIHATQESIDASIATFNRLAPGGTIMAAPANLGVALNFDRAERFFYEYLETPTAIFLEDDMVLSDRYIATLDQLVDDYRDDPRVGYLAAYGDHRLSLDEQRADPSQLAVMHHLWGFASFRRQWLSMRPWMQQYLRHVAEIDYRDRDHAAIEALFASWGFGCPATSQDAAKTMACILTGSVKVNTRVVLGRYIGEFGLHATATLFEERGYRRTTMFTDPLPKLEPLTESVYRVIADAMLVWADKPQLGAIAAGPLVVVGDEHLD